MHEYASDEVAHTSTTRNQVAQDMALPMARSSALPTSAMSGTFAAVQRLAGNAGAAALVAQRDVEEESPVTAVVEGSGGQSMDAPTRSLMEGKLGHDFSDVRIHTDSAASASAESVQANAYTVGSNVVFREGQYSPGTQSGERTLAHELTHVVQQRQGPVSGTPAAGGIEISHPDDAFEREAVAVADSVVSGGPAEIGGVAAPSLQRDDFDGEEESLQREEMPEEEEMLA